MPIVDKKNTSEMQEYAQFVRTSPYATATQDPSWAQVKRGWGDAQIYLRRDGAIAAALSLLIRPVGGGFCVLYAPRGPVCDFYDLDTVEALMREADAFAKARRAVLLRFDPEVRYDEALLERYRQRGYRVRAREADPHALFQPRHNMVLDRRGKTEESLLAEFSQKTRYNIRVAARNGITVRFSRDREDLRTFYRIYEVTCTRDRIGARPFDYFERMLDAFGEDCRVYLAEHEGEALSGALAVAYGDKVWYSYGASSNEHRNLMPNYAMQLEMIRWALTLGKDRYDFGGVYSLSKDNGLFRFKEGFCRQAGVTEYIGEFDRVYSRPLYFAFEHALPLWRKIRSGGRSTPAEGGNAGV